MKGLANTTAKARGTNGDRLQEGKDPMPYIVYMGLCNWLVQDDSAESIFAHCFLVLLTWNLMCRSVNTVNVMRQHISWQADSMTIKFARTKNDTQGKRSAKERHLYANSDSRNLPCHSSCSLSR
jgi:hypothetical protein